MRTPVTQQLSDLVESSDSNPPFGQTFDRILVKGCETTMRFACFSGPGTFCPETFDLLPVEKVVQVRLLHLLDPPVGDNLL